MPTYDADGALLISLAGVVLDHEHSAPGDGGPLAVGTTDTDATPGSVFFAGAGGLLQQDNANLFYDDGNNRFGVGTAVPIATYHQQGTAIGLGVAEIAATPDTLLLVEGTDAFVECVGDDAGQWVSGIIFSELSAGALTDKWGILRQSTTVGDSSLSFSYGANSNPWANSFFLSILTDGNVGINDVAPSRRLQVVDDSASSGVIIPIARLESQVSGGAGAAGHGPSLELYGETTTTENQSMGQIAARWSVATHASRRARLEFYAAYIGTDVLVGVIEAPATASAAGNSRGVGAVDLQGYRTGVAQVAGGDYSVLIGGQRSEIGGAVGAVIVGGYDHSVGGGADQAGVLAGYDHLIDGAAYAAIVGGREALLNNYGQITRASGMFSTQGDAQSSDYVARIDRATHAVNTWYPLFLDGASIQMTIQPSTAWTFEVLVVGLTANAAQQWGYRIIGLIERDNAGNTTMAASTTTTIFESDANYDAQAVADNVNEALDIEVRRTGGVDYSVQWVATVRMAECTHT